MHSDSCLGHAPPLQAARTIAERVVERKIPLVLLTDCYWAQELTPHVLMV
ncbi:hypothetical protein P5Y53_08710 [Dyella jiangningensis]|nr:hypothetical protein [Dyella jiangningensis]MDG2537739.1 hypothetical protein [Dyella jiangningensis]